MNNNIRAAEVRVLDEEGENLGVMETKKALALANEKGLDLIEINSKSEPIIVRVISFDKYRYMEAKKLKNAKKVAREKADEQKRVQISPREAEGDLRTKAKRADKFLSQGSKVEVYVRMRGRENQNRQFAAEKLEQFLTLIEAEHSITSKSTGKKGLINAILAPRK
ncbi:MAG: translation initiation factor IF-3 [Candidatus Paceibacterota bacterium]